jgi:tyrosine-specific transport protein
MYKKIIGSILMILGTSVGAGMLALPIITSEMHITTSIAFLLGSWVIMTIGAFSLLEVNLWLPANTNMISMANKTLGPIGKILTWIIYLLLLYSLICAYLSGLSDLLQHLLMNFHLVISRSLATILVLFIFGAIVYRGISSVDIFNRGLMFIKLLAFFILVFLIVPHVEIVRLEDGLPVWQTSALMVMLTSFGYAIIIPSLRSYLNNSHILKKVVLIGSLIPLFLYLIWIVCIQGLIPKTGADGLITMLHSDNTNSLLMTGINNKIHLAWSSYIVKLFVSICAVTSFLGVSVCLTDFIADGINKDKMGRNNLLIYLLAYLPPLIIVLLWPGIFVQALNYAGILCLLLLIIIPLLMLYMGRYYHNLKNELILPGKYFIIGALVIGLILLVINLL